MRLYTYLTEAPGAAIDVPKVKELLKAKCKKNFDTFKKTNRWIYRGDRRVGYEYAHVNTTKFTRSSANTSNYYTLLFSGLLPSWKNTPRRDKAAICSSSASYARDYGKVYYIIPFDSTTIGICPRDDLWNSFSSGLKRLRDDFNFYYMGLNSLNDFNIFLSHELNIKIDKLPAALKKKLGSFKSEDVPLRNDSLANVTLHDYLNDILDPKKNGFTFTTDVSKVPSDERELWFSGEAVAIDTDLMHKIVKIKN